MRTTALMLLGAATAAAQFSQLAATDDGAQLYFATHLRLKSEAGEDLSPAPAIYRISEDRLQRFTNPPPLDLAFLKSHGYSQVSGGGEVVTYTLINSCRGGSSCFLNYPTTYTSFVRRNGQPEEVSLGGKAQVSRNGRYILSAGAWATFLQRTEYRTLLDLRTGQRVESEVWPASERQSLTGGGWVLGRRNLNSGPLLLWRPGETRALAIPETAAPAIVNDWGTHVVYEVHRDGNSSLWVHDLISGGNRLLYSRGLDPFGASVSNDGSLVLFLDRGRAMIARTDGSSLRPLARPEDHVIEAVLAGFGELAFAATSDNRLLRIDVPTGAVQEVVPRTPVSYRGFTALVPGSLLPLRGTGLAPATETAAPPLPDELGGVRLLAGGQPIPLHSVSPGEIWFQTPWELAPGTMVDFELAHLSPFGGAAERAPVAARAPFFFNAGELTAAHQDFSALVTRENPARPGEIVHLYAVGLGAVSEPIPSGAAAPVDRLLRVTAPFDCRIRDNGPPLDVLFAGLAPGMVGIYQVSVRMPDPLPASLFLNCGFTGSTAERHGGPVWTAREADNPSN